MVGLKFFLIKRKMSKEHFASLITSLLQSQEGAREDWDQIQDMRSRGF